MARNPASYVSSLTLDLRRMCERNCHFLGAKCYFEGRHSCFSIFIIAADALFHPFSGHFVSQFTGSLYVSLIEQGKPSWWNKLAATYLVGQILLTKNSLTSIISWSNMVFCETFSEKNNMLKKKTSFHPFMASDAFFRHGKKVRFYNPTFSKKGCIPPIMPPLLSEKIPAIPTKNRKDHYF